ncbi:unnamed protein product, partial [Prorocentrum cordatum]
AEHAPPAAAPPPPARRARGRAEQGGAAPGRPHRSMAFLLLGGGGGAAAVDYAASKLAGPAGLWKQAASECSDRAKRKPQRPFAEWWAEHKAAPPGDRDGAALRARLRGGVPPELRAEARPSSSSSTSPEKRGASSAARTCQRASPSSSTPTYPAHSLTRRRVQGRVQRGQAAQRAPALRGGQRRHRIRAVAELLGRHPGARPRRRRACARRHGRARRVAAGPPVVRGGDGAAARRRAGAAGPAAGEAARNQRRVQDRTHDFEPLLVTPKWFLSLFSIRGEALLRAWDAVLADGIEAAFRIGLALFARREEETIVRADAIDDIAALFLSPQGEVPPDVLLAAAYHKSLLGSGIDKSELEKRRCRALSKISSSDSNSPGGGLMAKRAMVPYLFARGTRDLMDAGRKERGGSEGYKFGDMSRGIASRVESKLKERAAATASVASPAASHRGCRQRSAAASAAARPASGPPARAGSAPRRPGARAPPGPRRWWARGGTAIARCGSQRRASPRRAGPPSCASRSAWCGAAGRCLECCAKRATGTSGPRWRTARKRWAPCACGSATTRGCWWPASGRPARPCGARTLSQAGWRSGLTDREFAAQMEDMPDRRVGRSHRPRRPPRHRSAWAPPPPAPRGVARARVPTPNTNRCIRHVRRAALRRS